MKKIGRPPISEEKKIRVVTDIPESTYKKLQEAAEGKTVAKFVRIIISLFLKK